MSELLVTRPVACQLRDMIVYFVPGLMTALILTLIVIVFILKVRGSRRNNEASAAQRHGQNDSNADPGIFFVRPSYFHLTLIQTSLHGNELAFIDLICTKGHEIQLEVTTTKLLNRVHTK